MRHNSYETNLLARRFEDILLELNVTKGYDNQMSLK